MASPPAVPVLLYDGECGLCAGSVQFVLAREPRHRRDALQFAPLDGEFGRRVRQRHPELAAVDSVIWVEPDPGGGADRVRVRSAAALAALAHLGGAWKALARLGWLVPAPLRDAVYDAIARRRTTWVARACLLPSPADRHRFLS